MRSERERTLDDIDEHESTIQSIEDEMRIIELDYPNDYEDDDRWNDLYHELTEHQNAVQYLEHCLEDM